MTVKRYMWENDLYTYDELKEKFEGFDFSDDDFREYLEANYTVENVFKMKEEDRVKVVNDFIEHGWELFLEEEVIEYEIAITPQEELQAICSLCPYKIAMKERLKNEM